MTPIQETLARLRNELEAAQLTDESRNTWRLWTFDRALLVGTIALGGGLYVTDHIVPMAVLCVVAGWYSILSTGDNR